MIREEANELQHSKLVSACRLSLLREIEFEVRQWYAGDYDASACAERILSLILDAHDRAVEGCDPNDHPE